MQQLPQLHPSCSNAAAALAAPTRAIPTRRRQRRRRLRKLQAALLPRNIRGDGSGRAEVTCDAAMQRRQQRPGKPRHRSGGSGSNGGGSAGNGNT